MGMADEVRFMTESKKRLVFDVSKEVVEDLDKYCEYRNISRTQFLLEAITFVSGKVRYKPSTRKRAATRQRVRDSLRS